MLLCRTIWGYLGLGPTFGSTCVRPDGAQLQQIADWVSEGKLKPVVDRAYPLERAACVSTSLLPRGCMHETESRTTCMPTSCHAS